MKAAVKTLTGEKIVLEAQHYECPQCGLVWMERRAVTCPFGCGPAKKRAE